jgi:transcription factor E2F7/8
MLLPAGPPGPIKSRKEKSLGVLCANFMDLFKDMPPNRDNNGTVVEICQVADRLGVARRRIYDVINILESIDIVCRVKKNTYRWHGKDGLAEVFARMQRAALMERAATAAGGGEDSAAIVDETVPPVVEQQPPLSPPPATNKTKGMAQTCQKLIQIFLVTGRVDIGLAEAAEEVLGPLSPAEEADAAKAMKTKVRRMYDIANVLTSIGILSKENVGSTSLQNKPSFKWVYHVLPSELGNHIPPIPPPVSNADASSSSMMMIETAAAAAAAGAAEAAMPLAADEGNPSSAMLTAEDLVSQEGQNEPMQVEI